MFSKQNTSPVFSRLLCSNSNQTISSHMIQGETHAHRQITCAGVFCHRMAMEFSHVTQRAAALPCCQQQVKRDDERVDGTYGHSPSSSFCAHKIPLRFSVCYV
ncbi:hypothetical protein NC653_029997 [Populus alba x Populus x berolinensis]|uniref:Uncharacterized protein n=1 Tax=Populus alba x Populus x berolinensis TaxID=444605 RepID=A0AAD6M3S5_9ROSI|nr:hypothetical protein NC653_029997 [Populus alba x Populus x berolinensis]